MRRRRLHRRRRDHHDGKLTSSEWPPLVVGEATLVVGDRFIFPVMVAVVVAGEDGVVRDSMHGEWREKEVGRGVGEMWRERRDVGEVGEKYGGVGCMVIC